MQFELDTTGISPSNRIIEEVHNVSPPTQLTDANFFIPRVTPFFEERLEVKLGNRVLVKNVDYILVLYYEAASAHFTRELYAGIMMVNRAFTGTVKVSYQVLGGEFQNNDYGLLERAVRNQGKIRWVNYDTLINLPSGFPPAYHTHDIETDLVNMGSVVTAVEKIAIALGTGNGSADEISARLQAHINSNNAHTKAAVGLGNLENYPVATLDDINRGTPGKYVTADGVKAYVAAHQSHVDLSGYYRKGEVDTIIGRYVTTERLTQTETKLSTEKREYTTRMNGIDAKINELNTTLHSGTSATTVAHDLQTNVTAINNRINGLETKVNTATSLANTNKIDIASLNRKIDNAKTELSTSIGGVNTRIGTVETKANRVDDLTTQLNTAKTTIAQLQQAINDLNAKFNKVAYMTHESRYDGELMIAYSGDVGWGSHGGQWCLMHRTGEAVVTSVRDNTFTFRLLNPPPPNSVVKVTSRSVTGNPNYVVSCTQLTETNTFKVTARFDGVARNSGTRFSVDINVRPA